MWGENEEDSFGLRTPVSEDRRESLLRFFESRQQDEFFSYVCCSLAFLIQERPEFNCLLENPSRQRCMPPQQYKCKVRVWANCLD